MWIQYALFSSFLWAIVHILDEHCVDSIFSKPWLGVITSSGISAGIFLLVPFLNQPIIIPSWDVLLICMFTGAIIQLSQVYYFRALDFSDSGTVAAYWNLTPTFLPVISYWLFGYIITGNNYIGIGLLLIASIGLCVIDKFESKWDTLYLMSIAASLQTGVVLLEKYIFDRSQFFGAFLSISMAIVITGLLSLGMREVRVSLVKDLPKIKKALPVFIIIELINWVALYTGQTAVKMGVPSLVSAIEASIPAFAFGISLSIAMLHHKIDAETKRKLPIKWMMVGLMMIGVWLIGAGIEA
ncbi:transporter [Chamaesiphon minutus]|uniref:EamA-like transporter family n=1 Tax=Chamaesiphon minutus (strain ATCC 27169 / PCC 6605) TaxID=1173020 RepID=K9UER9_CHAP6|nr:transporter [Chamaesiphon minutus]AFY93148.1 EamA-like transporter family [Chamaesiphon minutus PCC 6605]